MIYQQSVFETWPIESESVQAVVTGGDWFCSYCEISIPRIGSIIDSKQTICPFCNKFKLITTNCNHEK